MFAIVMSTTVVQTSILNNIFNWNKYLIKSKLLKLLIFQECLKMMDINKWMIFSFKMKMNSYIRIFSILNILNIKYYQKIILQMQSNICDKNNSKIISATNVGFWYENVDPNEL